MVTQSSCEKIKYFRSRMCVHRTSINSILARLAGSAAFSKLRPLILDYGSRDCGVQPTEGRNLSVD
jgi:hypothetical protein